MQTLLTSNFLRSNADQLLKLREAVLEKTIFESCRIKKEIVEEDEKENGKRRLLNFGHTIGHALEKLTRYALPHGEAVAIGLLVESRMSLLMGNLKPSSFGRIRAIMKTYGLPLKIPAELTISSVADALSAIKNRSRRSPALSSSKRSGRLYPMVLPIV